MHCLGQSTHHTTERTESGLLLQSVCTISSVSEQCIDTGATQTGGTGHLVTSHMMHAQSVGRGRDRASAIVGLSKPHPRFKLARIRKNWNANVLPAHGRGFVCHRGHLCVSRWSWDVSSEDDPASLVVACERCQAFGYLFRASCVALAVFLATLADAACSVGIQAIAA